MEQTATLLVRETVKQFPNAPALTLAKKLYAEHPQLWSCLESCRSAVRKVLGIIGKQNRMKGVRDKSLYREPRKPGDWKDYLPTSVPHFAPKWHAEEIAGPHRVLVLSDIHVPYHDEEALTAAVEFGIQRKATMVLLNGDVVDFFALSRWEKDPRKRNFALEVKAGRSVLQMLKKAFPRARMVWKEGNHEERYEKYLMLKAPELLGLEDFSWEHVYDLEKMKVHRVGDKRPVRLGKLNVLHGHEYRFAIQNPVNPARGLFLRAQTHALAGHFHQSSQHSQKNLEQRVVTCFSTGCLCDMHPDYAPLNNWSAGFAFVTLAKDGSFSVENMRVIRGKVY